MDPAEFDQGDRRKFEEAMAQQRHRVAVERLQHQGLLLPLAESVYRYPCVSARLLLAHHICICVYLCVYVFAACCVCLCLFFLSFQMSFLSRRSLTVW